MARGWAEVLRRRAVAHLGASQASRLRAVRLVRMADRRRVALSGEGGVLTPGSDVIVACSLPLGYDSLSGNDSEDEPLSRRVKSYSGFQSSTFDVSSGSTESEKEVESGEGCSLGSEGSECEEASEEDSQTEREDDSDDDLIYVGRESAMSALRSQALLSRWTVPVVTAVEV